MPTNPYSTANSDPGTGMATRLRISARCGDLFARAWVGNGEPVVLLHGIGSSGASWESLAPGLGERFSPLAIDLRGHGHSAKPDTGYLYDDYIDDVDDVLAHFRLARPLLIGHSLGGIVALWWAARHPERAAALVVVDSPLRSGEEFRPAFDQWIAQNAMSVDELAAVYLARNPDWSDEQAVRRAEVMTSTAPQVFSALKADSLAHEGVDRIAELEGITSPILFLHGDPETGSQVHPADLERLAAKPNVAIVRFPGVGHALHRERPEAFLQAVIPFLARHAGSTAGSSARG